AGRRRAAARSLPALHVHSTETAAAWTRHARSTVGGMPLCTRDGIRAARGRAELASGGGASHRLLPAGPLGPPFPPTPCPRQPPDAPAPQEPQDELAAASAAHRDPKPTPYDLRPILLPTQPYLDGYLDEWPQNESAWAYFGRDQHQFGILTGVFERMLYVML